MDGKTNHNEINGCKDSRSYKDKVIPLQAWCGPEGGQRYSSTLP